MLNERLGKESFIKAMLHKLDAERKKQKKARKRWSAQDAETRVDLGRIQELVEKLHFGENDQMQNALPTLEKWIFKKTKVLAWTIQYGLSLQLAGSSAFSKYS